MTTISNYLQQLQREGKAENTIKTYAFHLQAFQQFLIDNEIQFQDVKQSHLRDFKNRLLDSDKKNRTINAILSAVRGYYDYLILHEQVNKNPVIKQLYLKNEQVTTSPLTSDEFAQFLSYFERLQENIYLAFLTLATTGARVGEVAALKKRDFVMKKNRLCIDIKNAKWGSDRTVPILHKPSATRIKQYINDIDLYDQAAFKVSRRTLQTYAQKFSNDTGIDFHCHKLRHTIATRLLEQGVEFTKIQHLLGHKSQYVTQHYTSQANIDLLDITL